MQIKKGIFRFLCACEIIFFVYVIAYSEHGYYAQGVIVHTSNRALLEISILQKDVVALRTLLHDWSVDSFFIEKCYRERLDVMNSNDEIYFF